MNPIFIGRKFRFYSINVEHIHFANIFGIHLTLVGAVKIILNVLVGSFGNIYPVNISEVFHSGSYIDGFAPNVISKLFPPHNSCNYGTGMNAYANLPGRDTWFGDCLEFFHEILYFQTSKYSIYRI